MFDIPSDKSALFESLAGSSSRTVIVSHVHPDGDAIGCVTAMYSYLHDMEGKSPKIVLPSPPPSTLAFVSDSFPILWGPECEETIKEADLIIALDFNSFSRADCLGEPLRKAKAKKILIDHHPDPEESAFDIVFSRTDVSSASEHLFHILKSMSRISGDASRLPSQCAYSLMTGMTTDTNNLSNSVFPSTLQMASELIAAGVDRDGIIQNIYNSGREEKLRAWSYLLDRKMVVMECGAAYMILDRETSETYGLDDGETDGLVNVPLRIKKVRMSALLTEKDGYIRVSLRSKAGTSARDLASECFHGGGHILASGGKIFIPGDIADISQAPSYFEEVTARFMRDHDPAEKRIEP